MINKNNNYAGFWRRYSANVLDVVIISFLLLALVGDIASIMRNNLLTYCGYEKDAVQNFLFKYEPLLRVFGFGIPWYRDIDIFTFLIPLSYRLSFFILFPFFPIFIWCYYAGLESSPLQATIGKLAVGLYVTDNKGERISFGRATARHFSKIISNIILLLGYCLAGWTSKKQALHDIISGCLVLKR